uniref:hypothetical protein n=1 Tax=Lachnoclostridium phocaeense TaxID=1871021 RepID=UPI0026DCFAB2|nr:hypothetical protein [Lachnoclostridium phocaeense]
MIVKHIFSATDVKEYAEYLKEKTDEELLSIAYAVINGNFPDPVLGRFTQACLTQVLEMYGEKFPMTEAYYHPKELPDGHTLKEQQSWLKALAQKYRAEGNGQDAVMAEEIRTALAEGIPEARDDKQTVYCKHCDKDVSFSWSENQGYKSFCPVCGQVIMLCDACKKAGFTCDFKKETGCRFDERKLKQYPRKIDEKRSEEKLEKQLNSLLFTSSSPTSYRGPKKIQPIR